jgi:hypothetical protein
VVVDWSSAAVRGGNARSDSVPLLATVQRDVRFGVMQAVWTVVSGNLPALQPLPGLPEAVALLPGVAGSLAEYQVRVAATDR